MFGVDVRHEDVRGPLADKVLGVPGDFLRERWCEDVVFRIAFPPGVGVQAHVVLPDPQELQAAGDAGRCVGVSVVVHDLLVGGGDRAPAVAGEKVRVCGRVGVVDGGAEFAAAFAAAEGVVVERDGEEVGEVLYGDGAVGPGSETVYLSLR